MPKCPFLGNFEQRKQVKSLLHENFGKFQLKLRPADKGVARGGGMPPPSTLDKSKDLGNYGKYLPQRDCFLAGLLIYIIRKWAYKVELLYNFALCVGQIVEMALP